MSRISTDVTYEQHQKLKALAAIQGKSIKDFVLERTLGADDSDAQLEALLGERMAQAEAGHVSKRSVSEIFQSVVDEEKSSEDV